EVDCTALPYAKGEERDFCYQWGHWGVCTHEGGVLVACNCGEFGGFVLWYNKHGDLLQTLIAGDIPQILISDGDGFLCVTGISHVGISKGAMEAFRLVDDRWEPVGSTKLAREAERVEIEPDGSLVIQLTRAAGTFRYRAGVLEQLPSSLPNSAQQPTSAPSGA